MAISEDLPQKAEMLRAWHRRDRPLVLVNAWDTATARIFEKAGSTLEGIVSHATMNNLMSPSPHAGGSG